jgi:hypothetical protein
VVAITRRTRLVISWPCWIRNESNSEVEYGADLHPTVVDHSGRRWRGAYGHWLAVDRRHGVQRQTGVWALVSILARTVALRARDLAQVQCANETDGLGTGVLLGIGRALWDRAFELTPTDIVA